MTDVIQLLPDSVANQIAAGEVIQRPASVIKELVENAVDAGARNIRVLVVDAGRTLIQVIDDGTGMSETDARLAFERHATSKIRKADDLFSLHTMGFRGEALPSIAAVAQVVLTTRMQGEEVGTRLTLAGSQVVGQEPVSCPVGSNFRVENLFFNVPARRKFLKTNATELSNIMTAFERIVLVYPDIAFSLHSNGQEVLSLHAGSQRQRIADVYGRRLSQELLPLEVDTALCRIKGFVGKPEAARKKGVQEYFFVNGRFMKHPYFHKAVAMAYERMVTTGLRVPYFIYIEVNPADIDVNIHPTKTEIKFENEQDIFQLLTAAVKDAIGRFCEVPAIDFDTEGRPDIPVFDPTRNRVEMPRVSYNPAYNPFSPSSSRPKQQVDSNWQRLFEGVGQTAHTQDDTSEQCLGLVPDAMSQQADTMPRQAAAIPRQAVQSVFLTEKSPVHYQYKGRYIMTAVKSGLMVIDQYRADVRIRYDEYMQQLAGRPASTQRLLFPEVVQLSPAQLVTVQRVLPGLTAMGFDLTDLGGGSYALAGVPAGLDGLDAVALFTGIVADATDQLATAADDARHALALSLARQAAVPQGQVLSNDEMEAIVNRLFSCQNVNYTPDGKTILAILPQHDIEQLFQ